MIVYNEIDPFAAEWLVQLAWSGLIADGRVDARSIRALDWRDVGGLTQLHAFAGIGVWSYALRLAGWPDGVPVWTGSCPCQPFSTAGKRKGADDERHLWPEWRRLIEECLPPVVFGEQVASPDGRAWLATVRSDLEALGYAVGAADLCAAGVGAPHVRQRLYFVALSDGERLEGVRLQLRERAPRSAVLEAAGHGEASGLDFTDEPRSQGRSKRAESEGASATAPGGPCGLADADGRQSREAWGIQPGGQHGQQQEDSGPLRRRDSGARAYGAHTDGAGPSNGFWGAADWLLCQDGKYRPVEPGTFPLAHGSPARLGRLRGYGNAVVPQVAATFVRAAMQCLLGKE